MALSSLPTSSGTEKYVDAQSTTMPGTPQDLISDTVPAATQRFMSHVLVVCRAEGSFVVTADGAIIGEGKTGPGNPNAKFSWAPARPLSAGVLVKVTFTGAPGTAPRDVGVYLQASDVPL